MKGIRNAHQIFLGTPNSMLLRAKYDILLKMLKMLNNSVAFYPKTKFGFRAHELKSLLVELQCTGENDKILESPQLKHPLLSRI